MAYSLLANFSFKYFGKRKSISIYTFIDELHRLLTALELNFNTINFSWDTSHSEPQCTVIDVEGYGTVRLPIDEDTQIFIDIPRKRSEIILATIRAQTHPDGETIHAMIYAAAQERNFETLNKFLSLSNKKANITVFSSASALSRCDIDVMNDQCITPAMQLVHEEDNQSALWLICRYQANAQLVASQAIAHGSYDLVERIYEEGFDVAPKILASEFYKKGNLALAEFYRTAPDKRNISTNNSHRPNSSLSFVTGPVVLKQKQKRV